MDKYIQTFIPEDAYITKYIRTFIHEYLALIDIFRYSFVKGNDTRYILLKIRQIFAFMKTIIAKTPPFAT